MLANSTLQTILDRLEGVKRAGNGYTARCPGHDDNRNSLSIKIADNGKILLHCFAGCKTDKICADIELDMQDLFPADTGRQAKRREIATHDYTDESGNLLFQKVRYEPKDFRIRVPDGNGDWNWKMKVDFTDKVGGAFATGGGQTGGKEHVVVSLLLFMLNNRMIVAGPLYEDTEGDDKWAEIGSTAATGPTDPGVLGADIDGARRLGERIAGLIGKSLVIQDKETQK